ncbi:MAG: cytochrome c3 family protein [Desulfobacterales bacterium]|nr:cytochrome c3 family protein [Desulfobacterales bacterium]
MKKRPIFRIATAIGMAILFIAGVVYAGTEVPDVFKMENPAYKKHKKGIVEFTHKKHAADYGATCGECHHDENNKPLELKEGDDVQPCLECHKIPGQVPKKVKKELKKIKDKAEKKSKKLEYHAEAVHMNCIVCHKAFNKKNKTKKAPQTCSKCHPKKKKK